MYLWYASLHCPYVGFCFIILYLQYLLACPWWILSWCLGWRVNICTNDIWRPLRTDGWLTSHRGSWHWLLSHAPPPLKPLLSSSDASTAAATVTCITSVPGPDVPPSSEPRSQDSLLRGTRVCMIPPVVHGHCLRGAQTWDRFCTSSCCWARKTCLCFYPAYLLCLCACSIVPVDFSLTKCKFRNKVIKDFKIATVEH